MNHLPAQPALDPPDTDATAAKPGGPDGTVPRGRVKRSKLFWIAATVAVALVLTLAGLIASWLNTSRLDFTEREFARRIQESDSSAKESRVIAHQAQDQVVAVLTRVGVLEAKLAESQSQQLALEQLYQDLSRTRDDWALAEIEQILSVASQQLQLAGNVRGAIIGLQNADNRLSRADKPQFISLRRAIQRDLDRLNALPDVDLAGNALRIDSLLAMVDSLPMFSDEKPALGPRLDAEPLMQEGVPAPARKSAPASESVSKAPASSRQPSSSRQDWAPESGAPPMLDRIRESIRYAAAEAWQEFQKLVRVRRVEKPDALLVAPEQAWFVRENLKLRLLNARLALLARQEATYRADLLRAEDMLQQYFDTRSKKTVDALALLKQIQASNTVVELPTLAESLSAVRHFKAPRER